jgi:type IV pilus assembly protein PilB
VTHDTAAANAAPLNPLQSELLALADAMQKDGATAAALARRLDMPLHDVESELEALVQQGALFAYARGGGEVHYRLPRKKLLGRLLLEAGIVTEQQLDEALAEQKRTGEPLGQILVGRGHVSAHVLGSVLGQQGGLPYVNLRTSPIDTQVLRSIPETLVTAHRVVAFARGGDVLSLAMVDPRDVVAVDQVRAFTRARVKLFQTTERDFDWVLTKYFDISRKVGASMQMVDDTEALDDLEAPAIVVSDSPHDPPVVQMLDSIVQGAARDGATDIHIEPQAADAVVRYRIDGVLYDKVTLPRAVAAAVASRAKVVAGLDIAEHVRPQDGRVRMEWSGRDLDLRVATVGTAFGERVAIRLLDKNRVLLGLERLGLLPEQELVLESLLGKPYGIILVTGPTGSGKTTTLYASLARINERSRNIITVEDPVEYHLPGITQIPVRAKMGATFPVVLRAILRQDPDVIMVGEIRDAETAQVAIQAALTGHLVLTTLHTNDAAGAIGRLVDMGVEPYLITSTILAAIGQRLVRVLCPACRRAYHPSAELRTELGPAVDDAGTLYAPVGCAECDGLGYRSRSGVFEVLKISDRIRALVLDRQPANAIREAARAHGMATMRDCGIAKLRDGTASVEELRRVVFAGVD